MAQQKLSHLIMTSLTMPGIEGFDQVEELKLDSRTMNIIPVVVVHANDITPEERKRLNAPMEAIPQKSSLSAMKFVDQVIHLLEESEEVQGGQR